MRRSPLEEVMGSTVPDPFEGLTADQRAWLLHSQALWRQAHAIVSRQPSLDASDVYRALQNLALPPAERLQRGLARVRIRPDAR